MVLVWHYFENRYNYFYGTGKGSNIAFSKNVVWQEFAEAVDNVEQQNSEEGVETSR